MNCRGKPRKDVKRMESGMYEMRAYVQKQISGPCYQMKLTDFEDTDVADWKIAVMKEEYRCVSTQSARWSRTASVPTARNAPMPTAPRGKSDMARTMVLDNRTTK